MQRQSKHAGVVGKNTGCAIALVNVQVNDGNLKRRAGIFEVPRPLGLHQAGSNRHIIEDTKPAALVCIRMVRAACHVGSDALAELFQTQRDARGGHRGANRAPRTFGHGQAPRKANLSLS